MLIGNDRKQPPKLEFEKGDKYKPIVFPTHQGPVIIGALCFHMLKLSDQWSVKGWPKEYFATDKLAVELYIDWWWDLPDKFTYGPYNPKEWHDSNF